MHPRSVDVTVGVIAYRRPDALDDVLSSLRDPRFDVVVVNVGHDSEVAAVVRGAGDHVRLIEMDNLGYAAAVNTIADVASAEVVVFANDDSRFTDHALLELAAVVRGREADVAVPRVVDGDRRLERTITALPTLVSLMREWLLLPDHPVRALAGHLRVEKWRAPQQPERIDAAAAVVVAVRRDLLRDEPLPEGYFLYWEESEWFWRLHERGAVVQYRPEITCEHDGGRDDVRSEKSRLLARNAVRCVRRTQGRAAGVAAVFVVILWNLRLALGDGLRLATRPDTKRRERFRARCAGLKAALASWTELR